MPETKQINTETTFTLDGTSIVILTSYVSGIAFPSFSDGGLNDTLDTSAMLDDGGLNNALITEPLEDPN